jgi:hypothetical protein
MNAMLACLVQPWCAFPSVSHPIKDLSNTCPFKLGIITISRYAPASLWHSFGIAVANAKNAEANASLALANATRLSAFQCNFQQLPVSPQVQHLAMHQTPEKLEKPPEPLRLI